MARTNDIEAANGSVQARPGRSIRRVQAIAGRCAAVLAIAIAAAPAAAGAHAPRNRHGRDHGHARLTVRLTPARIFVRQGRTARSRFRATVRNGSARSVSFHVKHLPAGVTAAFRPLSVQPGHVATLTLTAAASTPARTYRLHVVATTIGVRGRRAARLGAHAASASRMRRTVAVTLHVIPIGPPSPGTPPAWKVQSHVETWSFDDNCNGGVGTPQSVVRQWLTFAESDCGGSDTHALDDCHAGGTTYCTAIQYLDANMIYKTGSVPIASDAQESWWVHEPGYSDAAHRLAFDTSWGTGYLLDQANPAVQSWFQNYVHTNDNSFDGLMMDDTGASQSEQFYGSGHDSSRELPTNTSVVGEHRSMADAIRHTDGSMFMKIDNGLSVNPWLAPSFPLLNNGGVTGLIAEGDPISDGTIVNFYSTLLDDMSYVDHTPSDFLVLLSYDPNGSLRARRIQAATVLLGYKPGHIVSWSDLEQNNSNLSVWPEEGIYPTDPVQTMAAPGGSGCMSGNGQVCSSGGHNDLQVAPGVYRREFKTCYEQGVAFGNCAVIVNDTGATITVQSSWLTQNYQHEITMNGGDVQSGGTINPTGEPFATGGTTVAPHDAVLLGA